MNGSCLSVVTKFEGALVKKIGRVVGGRSQVHQTSWR